MPDLAPRRTRPAVAAACASMVGSAGRSAELFREAAEATVGADFKVVFTNIAGCAVGISDIMWSVTVSAGSEAEAVEVALERARAVNRDSGLPPHGLRVSEQELRRLACVVPRGDA